MQLSHTHPSHDVNLDFALNDKQIESYRENGFIHLKSVFPPDTVEHYRSVIATTARELNTEKMPLAARDTYGRAFLQTMNLWRSNAVIRELVMGRRLARIAAELMGCAAVRLYHDQALFKEPQGGITPWHVDQHYWPIDTDKTITAWIPLTDVPLDMGPLSFCPRSHRFQEGRDLEISDESEDTLRQRLESREIVEEPFDQGDVSFHAGWTFHRAGANNSNRMREVFTIIFLDAEARLVSPANKNQAADRERWCPGVRVGEVVTSDLNPVLYTRQP